MKDKGKRALTPKLRFPEFKDKPGWELRSLASLLSYERPEQYIVTNTAYLSSGTPVLTANKSFFLGYTSEVDGVFDDVPVIIFDDFTTDKKYVDFPFKIKSSAIKILKRTGKDDLKLIFDLMGGIRFDSKEHKRYYISEYQNIEIPLPHEAEQWKIAACLTSLDDLLAAEQRKLAMLRTHKKGMMQQLFPSVGESRPRLRFPEFRDGQEWKLGKASDYVDVLQGYGFPDRYQGRKDGEFPFYKVSDISAVVGSGRILLTDAKNHIDRELLAELRAKLLPVGTTIFAKIGEAIRSNKRGVTTRPCLIDNNIAGVKAIAGAALDEFVYHFWSMVPLIEHAGGVVPAVNKSAIEQIPVYFPEPAEQQRIAACLSSLDSLITAASRKLDGLRAHKKGLMQQLFPTPERV